MNKLSFEQIIQQSQSPIVVEFWAPWCVPCKTMTPALERVAQEYLERVHLIQINADESPEVTETLGILSIPTLVVFKNGQELFRRVGIHDMQALRALFTAALKGKQIHGGSILTDRILRLGSGAALLFLAWYASQPLLIIPAAALVFSAVYDRCPIYRAIAPRMRAFLQTAFAKKG